MAALIPSASATGSGTMTLAGPSTNSNQTITIPDATGTMMVSGNMPAFSAYSDGTSQSVASATFTKITLVNEEFDTNNNFASSRFTPTVAGYYQITGEISYNNTTSTGESFGAIFKNGSRFKDGFGAPFTNAIGSFCGVTALIYFNGSTDYVELYTYQDTGGTRVVGVGDAARTYFQGVMVRSA